MKTLGLDISTKTGYAVVTDGILTSHGLKTAERVDFPGLCEDFGFIARARTMGQHIYKLLVEHQPDLIIIEQTNLGQNRMDQKLLEFIHFEVLRRILEMERESQVRYISTSTWRSVLKIKLNADQKLNNALQKIGKVRGKVTPKHLAVLWANSTYGLELLKKDHDIADAIALATYGQRTASQPTEVKHDVENIFASNKLVVSSQHE